MNRDAGNPPLVGKVIYNPQYCVIYESQEFRDSN
jgi:hypothetical protein